MELQYHKDFIKHFKKLSPKTKNKVKETIVTFRNNPKEKSLKNHELKGKLEGKRAISVSGDLRIIFEEYDNYVIVLLLDVGTHNQVYGK